MNSTVILALALSLASTLLSCGGHTPPAATGPVHEVAGVLLPTSELAPPFQIQQRIRGVHEGREVAIDCVVQLERNKLSVVGLTPFSTRAFVIEQQGTTVRLQKFIDRDIPFDPAAVLYDLHRVFFRGLPKPQADGTHQGVDHGDAIVERWQGGHIVERRFQSLEGPIPQLVVVNFEGAPAPLIAPRVTLTNVAFGYTLQIESLEQQLLDPNYTLQVESKGTDAAVDGP
jgi:hypothetical protein